MGQLSLSIVFICFQAWPCTIFPETITWWVFQYVHMFQISPGFSLNLLSLHVAADKHHCHTGNAEHRSRGRWGEGQRWRRAAHDSVEQPPAQPEPTAAVCHLHKHSVSPQHGRHRWGLKHSSCCLHHPQTVYRDGRCVSTWSLYPQMKRYELCHLVHDEPESVAIGGWSRRKNEHLNIW